MNGTFRTFREKMNILSTLAIVLFIAVAVAAMNPRPAPAQSDSPVVAADQVDSVFDVANEEYKAGNFENAITLYEGLLAGSSIMAADVHYNIANASFKLNDPGKAIASYRRALLLRPRDRDIAANLLFVREAVVDKIDRPRGAEFVREAFFFHYSLSDGEAETVFLGAFIAASLLGAICLFRSSKALVWLTVAALAVTLTFGASCALRWRAAANPSQAVLVSDEADVHTGPGRNYIVSFNLHDGAEMKIRRVEGDWRQIELPDGRRGWIENSDLEVI
jgi:tetratricopeptide (TPR) repeat protein